MAIADPGEEPLFMSQRPANPFLLPAWAPQSLQSPQPTTTARVEQASADEGESAEVDLLFGMLPADVALIADFVEEAIVFGKITATACDRRTVRGVPPVCASSGNSWLNDAAMSTSMTSDAPGPMRVMGAISAARAHPYVGRAADESLLRGALSRESGAASVDVLIPALAAPPAAGRSATAYEDARNLWLLGKVVKGELKPGPRRGPADGAGPCLDPRVVLLGVFYHLERASCQASCRMLKKLSLREFAKTLDLNYSTIMAQTRIVPRDLVLQATTFGAALVTHLAAEVHQFAQLTAQVSLDASRGGALDLADTPLEGRLMDLVRSASVLLI